MKKKHGKYCYIYPVPTVLVGTVVDGKINFNTLGNCGIISMHPATIYISSDKNHYNNIGIIKNGVFSVNLPAHKSAIKADYCGLVSGKDTDKSKVFDVFFGESELVPMIEECPVCLECKIIKHVEVGIMDVFIAEVIQSYIDEDCIKNGIPDIHLIDPMIYTMKDNYHRIGDRMEAQFSIGKQYKV